MDNERITKYFEDNNIQVSGLRKEEGLLVIELYYEFSDDVIDAAKAYANDLCEDETESQKWFTDFYEPYLQDYAVDDFGALIEDIMEKSEVSAQYVSLGLDEDCYGCLFGTVIYEKGKIVDINKELDKLEKEE
jgi:hypothetical protein